jgi:hypothetical protein
MDNLEDISKFLPFVPKIGDRHLTTLIEKIGINAQPVYIDIMPERGAIENECFPNVNEKIKKEGGSIITGWQIWKTQNLIEAEFHAVWKSDSNNLLDVTPKQISFSQILFIEDNERVYDGSQIDNVRINISGNTLADDLISVCEAIFKIENKGFRKFEYELKLSDEEAMIWKILQDMKQGLSLMLYQGLTKHQTCFCRKDKYKKCHGRLLPEIKAAL